MTRVTHRLPSIAVNATFPSEQASLDDPFDSLYEGSSILTLPLALEVQRASGHDDRAKAFGHHDMSRFFEQRGLYGCDEVQGFYVAPPMPGNVLSA